MRKTAKWSMMVSLILSLICVPVISETQIMDDYTAYPPFITSGTKPNLLLMIDNSASMYDLAHIDKGNLPARSSSYCYDQTYSSKNADGSDKTYAGYFEENDIYVYDFTANRFKPGSFPAVCSNSFPGELCVNVTAGDPGDVTAFAARGNYLNWLTASKLDVQKKILTGGKYVKEELIAESRGCVGRGFVKEALTADYVEGGVNTSLGITFSINGPVDEINDTAPSPGGETKIEIYIGDYGEAECQAAIDAINYSSNPSAIRTTVEDCLSYDPKAEEGTRYCLLDPGKTCTVDSDCDNIDQPGDCSTGAKGSRTCLAPASKVGESCISDSDCDTVATSVGPCVGSTHSAEVSGKIVFNQSMQECWQIWSGSKTEVGNDAFSAEAPKCSDVYAGYKTCSSADPEVDGRECASDLDCDGGVCEGGPNAIKPGNAGLMCNSKYSGYCATTADDWATTNWVAQGYGSPQECFLTKYLEYCNALQVPPVIDPSDTPDDTAETANVPAIIADIGIEAQLGEPVKTLTVKRYAPEAPTGLLHDFSDLIRFGVMKFNFNGSDYECDLSSTDGLKCPRVCSVTTTRICTTNDDCPGTEKCTGIPENRDGGKIPDDAYIGDDVGDHDTGLIAAIDEIRADSWTPFAEAYYNAIAYFVKGATDNPELDTEKYKPQGGAIDTPLSSSDFDYDKNPIQYSCQKNNILLISDGAATSDINTVMTSKVKAISDLFNDGDSSDPLSCGNYMGSTYLDDLSYYAYNRNIFDPTDNDPSDDDGSQRIKTFVVYTGTEGSTLSGECAPKTLMSNTALNGGTSLYNPTDDEELANSLKTVFLQIAGDAASGSAVSVLATTGEGTGSVYQAYFYPEQLDQEVVPPVKRKWFGYMHSLFVDKYGNLREDTNSNKTLDMTLDKIIDMGHDSLKGAVVYKCSDANGDGVKESCLLDDGGLTSIRSVWDGGKALFERSPDSRNILTTTDGYTQIDLNVANEAVLKPWLRASDAAESTNMIKWVRGDDLAGVTDAGHPAGYRKRDITINGTKNIWKLGDIIYSTPTVVARPMENYDLLYGDSSYTKFRLTHINRRQAVYVGANDGILHAFNAGCFDEYTHTYYPDVNASGKCSTGSHTLGEELWGFIPRGLLPHLKWSTDPEYTHVYYIDQKPKVADVKVFTADSTHTEGWGTILISGFRYGGKNISWTSDGTDYSTAPEYFAMDITDPLNPRLLWTFTDPGLGLTTSYPAIAKIGDDWFAIFGSGPADYDFKSDFTAYNNGSVYVLKLSSGTNGVITSWTLNSNFWKLSTGSASAFLADPITVDVNYDYNVDVIYLGENSYDGIAWNGLMQRITTAKGTQTLPSMWMLSTLADINTIAGDKDVIKKITAAPSAAMDTRSNLWVFFGTGQFYGLSDKNQVDSGGFYAIKDDCWSGCAASYSSLLDVSQASVTTEGIVNGISGTCAGLTSTWSNLLSASYSCDGWALYFKNIGESVDFTGQVLKHSGERILSKPLVLGGLITFATYIPDIEECSNAGESNVYALYYETGSAYKKYVFNEQKQQDTPSSTVARVKKLGVGMPSTISAQVTTSGTTKGFVQSQEGSVLQLETLTPFSMRSGLRGWTNEQIP